MPSYKMDAAGVLEKVQLKEAKAVEKNSLRWQPSKVASNISRSLDSIKSASHFSNSSKRNADDELSNYSTTDDESVCDLLDKLNVSHSIPQLNLETGTSSVENASVENTSVENTSVENTSVENTFVENASVENTSVENTSVENTPVENIPLQVILPSVSGGDTPEQIITNKMAGADPPVDYGQTLRGDVEGSPDYDEEPKAAPPRSKPTGGVKLFPENVNPQKSSKPRAPTPNKQKLRQEREQSQKEGFKTYAETTPPEKLKDLSKLPLLTEVTINKCLHSRYKNDLIYTSCGDVLISVNPFRDLGIYTQKEMDQYNHIALSKEPHLYMISGKAYQDLRDRQTDQVILVSGESGAGKTEATKLLVKHVIAMAGSDDRTLQDKLIQVNPLLESFGNAKTTLNKNSSRFAKFLSLKFNENWMVQSGKIQDFMLEKSRVVRHGSGETNFHSFYAFLSGIQTPSILYIEPGQTFRITGDFSIHTSKNVMAYKEQYQQQEKVFEMLNLEKQEVEDIHVIMAAILHIGDIEFVEADDDCVNIKNESTVQKVANLLDLDREQLTQALIQRRGTTGRENEGVSEITPKSAIREEDGYSSITDLEGETILFSKKKSQAEDERDALAKALYEKLFGWLVRKINEALAPVHRKNSGSIGILDICGFENLRQNTFEQLCINIINEHLQNFMNKKIIEDEKSLYQDEGVSLESIDTAEINNTLLLEMFMKKGGFLDSIDEDSKHEVSADDAKMVQKLGQLFKGDKHYIPSNSSRPEFSIKHFAGKVDYNGVSFIKKNSDVIGELVERCLKASNSLLVKDMFHAPPALTGSISMSQYAFQGSKRGGVTSYKPLSGDNLSQSINLNNRKSLKSKFGNKLPQVKSSDFFNRKTHIFYFKNSLSELNRNMSSANPFFVRCIKPNSSLKPKSYNEALVQSQLKYNGIEEIARIRSCNLPVRMVRSDFVNRYGDLVPDANQDVANLILKSVNAQPNSYKVGKSQIFMTGEIQAFLEEDLTELRKKQEEERRIREAEEKRKREEEEKKEKARKAKEEAQKAKEEALRNEKEKKAEEAVLQEKKARKEKEANEKATPQLTGTDSGTSMTRKLTPRKVGFTSDLEDIAEGGSAVYSKLGSSPSSTSDSSTDSPGPSGQRLSDTQGSSATYATNAADDEDKDSIDPYRGEWLDHFQELTEEEVREDMSNLLTLKVIKAFLYIFLALLLLTALVIQKVSFITLIMDTRPHNNTEKRQTVAYFMLIIALCIPYAVGFIMSLFKLLFGISKSPSIWTWIWVISIEILHTFGMCLLIFRVMPNLDHFKVAYLLSVTAIVPAFLKFLVSDRKEDVSTHQKTGYTSWKFLTAAGTLFDFLAFAVQASAPVVIYYLDFYDANDKDDPIEIVELVGALVLVSANQWENFADGTICGVELRDESWFKNKMLKIRHELQECRHYPNIVSSVLKIGLTILGAYLLRGDISLDYETSFDEMNNAASRVKYVSAIIAVTISAFVAFNISLVVLKLQMQRFSFALPLCLATPVTVGVLYLDCIYDFLTEVTNTESSDGVSCIDRFMWNQWYHAVIFGLAWLLSLLIVCRHIWKRQLDTNSNMTRLFLNPFYCGVLTTEQIMLNQRRHQCKVVLNYKFEDNEIDIKSIWYKIERPTNLEDNTPQPSVTIVDDDVNNVHTPGTSDNENAPPSSSKRPKPITPKIYACATMWHETKQEMVQLLKSLHRLDYDQYLRKINQKEDAYDPNYYEFEAHIFFDDAMELDDDNARVPNQWVKDMVGCMAEACSSVHCKPIKVHDPVKMPTPYGGQLMWRMPGENLLFVHLKDMSKIRNRKRWSQVMYMYYLLDYRLKMFAKNEALNKMDIANKERGSHGLNIDELNNVLGEEHAAMSDKTFILALDGDTDFNPTSIRYLMERMDEDNVGAACGRIHPIGKGPMVWYQKFEYAIGHWLQKASEHVFGCVLCSPGCFSLFRARALMDTNVVRRYTTEPTEPGHHLQYDQGEDRWLCTLLLQRGYRIEYAASADAWTFAPEGFFEFYNQRRRWMPSTIANILDLLNTSDKTRKINANISRPYVMYTWLLMVMTLLGPGTILMMIAGAFQLIFKITLEAAYLWAVIPAAVYTIACFWLKSRLQLLIAAALSIVYAFVMLIVIVGTILTATTENIFHPSVVIMVLLLAIFLLTGICHPKEYGCLIHGLLYLMVIPSGYLLLVIFSICNLNDVSWGTREVPTKAQRLEAERKRKQKEEEKLRKGNKGFFRKLFDRGESSISELTNLLKTIGPKGEASKGLPGVQADKNLIDILKGIQENTKASQELLEKIVVEKEQPTSKGKGKALSPSPPKEEAPAQDISRSQEGTKGKEMKPIKVEEEDQLRPRWTRDKGLGNGEVIKANKDEIRFWQGLVNTYLYPIYPTAAEKKQIANGLRDLRNSSAFAFILVNGFWMALNFMFQYTGAAKVQMSYKFGDSDYHVEESVLGLSFVFLLLSLLLLQFVGMILHRFGTLQQLLSTTKLWGRNEDVQIGSNMEVEETIRHIRWILQMPAYSDEGMETTPPLTADQGNPLGMSIKPSDNQMILSNDLNQSVKALGTILDATRKNNSFLDRKSVKTLTEIRKRFEGTRLQGGMRGRSFRPSLPPRNNSRPNTNAPNPSNWINKQSKWGITANELKRLRPDQEIIRSDPDNDDRNLAGMGPLGRSLHRRARVIQEEQAKVNADRVVWDHTDLPQNRHGQQRSRHDQQRSRHAQQPNRRTEHQNHRQNNHVI